MSMNKQAAEATTPKAKPKDMTGTRAGHAESHAERKPAQRQEGGALGDTLAVVLVRGLICSRSDIRDTLVMLRLLRKNACVLVPDTPAVRGMLQKAKDYITWGRIDHETRRKLEARLKSSSDGKAAVFHLHPPRKGFGRKGIKRSFAAGGALGDRSERMNDLLRRMLE